MWCKFFIFFVLYFAILSLGFGQDSSALIVKVPFDSIAVTNVRAVGNIQTGSVEISLDFRNDYHELVDLHWSVGGFDGLGMTDDKGEFYKIYTSTKAIGAAGINKGYLQIKGVQFGSKKMDWLTYVKDTVNAGNTKKLKVTIPKMQKDVAVIKEFHARCILSVSQMWVGDEQFTIDNIKIEWSPRPNPVGDIN
ncbi:MAG: hypothetical protein E6Q24_05120 [Chitinophagaceae bacterium]|nr:MAG: hypothetical protein E6Q24_05120 [Chitinophagaceae bacterium]